MSRKLELLKPSFLIRVQDFKDRCYHHDLDILIYCTVRDLKEQSRLYRQGRSLKTITNKSDELAYQFDRPDLGKVLMGVGPQQGKVILTKAGPGQSLHNYGYAVDAVPVINGKLLWTTDDDESKYYWDLFGSCADESGLEWSGNWKTFKEYPHIQMKGVDWRTLIKQQENENEVS